MVNNKQATITIDNIANEPFALINGRVRTYSDVLGELQKNLRDKGDDPRYARVVFAVDGGFVEVNDRNVHREGVFSRIYGVRYEYGYENCVLKNIFSVNVGDTLIVANSQNIADKWEAELNLLEYPVKRL